MKRYQQQMILPELVDGGQEKIRKSAVLVVGAGGLGTIVTSYLGAMGFGKIGICDFDLIEETNLHRQFHFFPNEVGLKKSEILSQKLILQNPEIHIQAYTDYLNEENINSIFSDYQIICDCTDNAETRILIDIYCQNNNKPLIHGAVTDWQGYISVFHFKKKFGLKDLFELTDYLKHASCSIAGVNGAVCGIIGSYMANETLKVILGLENILEGKLLYMNVLDNKVRIINIKKYF
jgi:adenylyltransferase/sulfurtransferase